MEPVIIIDYNRAVELIESAIREKGADHLGYLPGGTGCSYYEYSGTYDTHGNELPLRKRDGRAVPSCLIGHCLDELGFDVSKLHRGSIGSIVGSIPGGNLRIIYDFADGRTVDGYEVQLTPEAYAFWQRAQSAQDSLLPWGEALADSQGAA